MPFRSRRSQRVGVHRRKYLLQPWCILYSFSLLSRKLTSSVVSLQYEPRIVYGKPPSSRGYHSAIVTDSRLFIFGGFNGRDNFEDVYVLDLAGAAYLPQVMSFEIEVT
jgi:hypothetical protein